MLRKENSRWRLRLLRFSIVLASLIALGLVATCTYYSDPSKHPRTAETWCRNPMPYAYWRNPFPGEYRWMLIRDMRFAAVGGCLDGKHRSMREAILFVESLLK